MPRDWFLRLIDILEAITKVETYLENVSYDEFETDTKTVDAVVRNLTVIGEAANHVPEEIQHHLPQVPWVKTVDLRNFVVHEYFGITLETIWETAKNRLPELKKEIATIVAQGRGAFSTIAPVKKKRTKRRPTKGKR